MIVSASASTIGRLRPTDFFPITVIADKEGINGKRYSSFKETRVKNKAKLKERIVPNNINTQCTPRVLFLTRIIMWIVIERAVTCREHECKCGQQSY
jgi:hypothetical protein